MAGGAGDCPEVLPSGTACRPNCTANYTLNATLTCSRGNLSAVSCVPAPLMCQAGEEQVGLTCLECSDDTYKLEVGPGPCLPCPSSADPRCSGENASALCNSTCPDRRPPPPGFKCPNNSHTEGGGAKGEHCVCNHGFRPQPQDEDDGPLQECRALKPCNVRRWLKESNLTGKGSHKLKLGTCAHFVNDSGGFMPSGSDCRLYCESGYAPQLQADFFTAVDTFIICTDGQTMGPPALTWCSETSFEIPPLVFLATVTLASLIAGGRMEWRQHNFEKGCAKALQIRLPTGSPPHAQPGHGTGSFNINKYKVA